MKKSKFIKSSIILIIGGFMTKILGLLVKIVLTRKIGAEGIGLYSLILPTFLLVISISGLSLPTALNVLISAKKHNTKKLMITSLIISLVLDLIIIIFLIFTSNFIANNLLNDGRLYYPIIAIGFTLPFITISNNFRSYYFANERMYPHVISNILEDVVKLLLIILFIDFFIKSKELTITYIIITNIFSELSSIIIFLILAPKFNIKLKDIKINKKDIKDLFKIAIPNTISRLIGSITYFFEPIIITYVLLKLGYSSHYILTEYGIISGYVLPLILLPSFFTNAISQALIPVISSNYTIKNFKYIRYKIKQALIISLILGLIFTSIFIFKGQYLLKLIYNTDQGYNYIKFIAPVFLLHYLQHPLLSALQAMQYTKINMLISIINMFIRTVLLFILLNLDIGLYALLIVLGINITFTCLYAAYKVNKLTKKCFI